MFTGLIQAVGRLRELVGQGGGTSRLRLDVRWPEGDAAAAEVILGDSIAVNGACLTVVELGVDGDRQVLGFDLSHETLALTCYVDLAAGDPLNLERALRLGDRLGGHLVTGHVDGVGALVQVVARGEAWDLTYAVPPALEPEIVTKGSITVDGVSLTVNATPPGQFCVTLIPHTVAHTQLLACLPAASSQPGQALKRVHLETDLLAKHVHRLLQLMSAPQREDSGISLQLLQRSGFLSAARP